ncbi:MAG: DNA replication and repair protein RecF [Lewinellaceae bacterium]|nr:DNA replication and repair protein RecF [Lewinellaceae bacterium]
MHLERLILTNFKNYTSQTLQFSATLNCLVGLNGMGKTNLLDAIYYLCMTKSHFGLPDSAVVRHEDDFFRLESYFQRDGKQEKVVAKVQPRKEKTFERNNIPYDRLSEHIGLLPVVFIAPDDTQLISEGSEFRRRFLDNTLSQLDARYLSELLVYNRILQQRNALLKQMGEQRNPDRQLLAIYDEQLAAPASYLFEQRQQLLAKFQAIFLNTHQYITGRAEEVALNYQSGLAQAPLKELLAQAREKDLALQRTTQGIHRDDLEFTLEGHSLKRFGSQGQRKSFILALKLAQFEILRQNKGSQPLLLLDDLFDKLDQQRVTKLLRLLTAGQYGQLFLTDTHPERVEHLARELQVDYRMFTVSGGLVSTTEG